MCKDAERKCSNCGTKFVESTSYKANTIYCPKCRRVYRKALYDLAGALTDFGKNTPPIHCRAQLCKGDCKDCVAEINEVARQLENN